MGGSAPAGGHSGRDARHREIDPVEPVHKQTFEFAALTRAAKLHKWFRICFPKLPLFLCCKKNHLQLKLTWKTKVTSSRMACVVRNIF